MRHRSTVALFIAFALLGGGCSSDTQVTSPIGRASERITKKPFGLHVTRTDSPVTQEVFSGYHTGVDFETFTDEQDKDVPIMAICTGTLLVKEWATGYGGVAVQQCAIDDQTVTVIYGHLKLSSVR